MALRLIQDGDTAAAADINQYRDLFLGGLIFDVDNGYGAVGNGIADDTVALQSAIDAAIAAHGVVRLGKGPYRITSALDFSAMRNQSNAGASMVGLGSGDNTTGFGAATLIHNDHAGPAIIAYGTLVTGVSSLSVSALTLKGFAIQNTQNIGAANYTIDLDYTGSGVNLEDIYVWGQNFTGNGIRWRNMFHGQSSMTRVQCRGFRTGIGVRLAVETTANVDTAPNSGNITLDACAMFDVLTGYDLSGTNTFNNGVLLNCKAVNITDVASSVGIKVGTGCRGWSIISPHTERFSTGIWLDYAEHCVVLAPHTSFPAGTPDAGSCGIKMSQAATGNVVTSAMLFQTHYGVTFADSARTNSVHGSDRTGLRVLTAWSLDTSTNGSNHVIKTEGEAPFLWTMPRTKLAVGKIGLTYKASPSLTASVNNWAAVPNGEGIVRITSDGAYDIGGIVAGSDGDVIRLYNLSSFTITLLHGSTSSAAANQIICPNNASVLIRQSGSADLWYDGTSSRWRVLGA